MIRNNNKSDNPNVFDGAISIDFGSSYCCVGVKIGEQVEIIPNQYGNGKTPACIAFTSDTDEILIGEAAIEYSNINNNTYLFYFKQLIEGDNSLFEKEFNNLIFYTKENKLYIQTKLNIELSTEQIISFLIRKLKENAEHYLSKEVKKIIISVPSYFSDQQKEIIRDAGRMTGLEVLRIIKDPIAAGIAYGFGESNDEFNVVVFNMGRSTLNISVVNVDYGVFEIKSNVELPLGGKDFDNRLVQYCKENIKKKYNVDLNQKALSRLQEECEKAKKDLSRLKTKTNIYVESICNDINYDMVLTNSKFEQLNMDLFKKSIQLINLALEEANLNKSQIRHVVLVGGSTCIPKVQTMIMDFFNNEVKLHNAINPDEVISYGGAVHGHILVHGRYWDSMISFDVNPLSLGIETAGGLMTRIVERNSIIPCKKSQIFTTYYNNQMSVLIKVYEGERLISNGNNLLGEFRLRIPPHSKGEVKIEVTFDIDYNGILTVLAKDLTNDNIEKIIITNDKGRLSIVEIEEMIKIAEEKKKEDEEFKWKVDSKRKSEILQIKDTEEGLNVEETLKLFKSKGFYDAEIQFI